MSQPTTLMTLTTTNGRTIAFADFGQPQHTPVLWCHGGPGSRLEPASEATIAEAAGFRLIGIDRPGYGASTASPGRSIADWTNDALAVADHLNLDRFFMVGVSTGGAYALATAAAATSRIRGVIACCAVTDMRWGKDNAMLTGATTLWDAPDRGTAQAIAIDQFGEDGSKMMQGDEAAAGLAPADLAFLANPEFAATFANNAAFAQGVDGYVDDRLADSPANGWSSFDCNAIACPVGVIHGELDGIVPVAHAHHTSDIVPGARLRTYPEHGHLSIITEVVPTLTDLLKRH